MATLDYPDAITNPQAISTAGELVAERFGSASQYAGELWAAAQALLAQLAAVDFTIDWAGVDLGSVDAGGLEGLTAASPTPPTVGDITVTSVEFGYAPPSPVETILPDREAPTQNITDPGFSIPDAPTVDWPTFSEVAPTISDAALPEAPSLTLPSVPQLSDVVVPSPPSYSVPEFTWELPSDDIADPSATFSYTEGMYTSALATQLKSDLLADLIAGGSGFPEATEQAIYDRATSRMTDEEQLALDQMLDFFAGRGFDLPPGALSGQMLELNNKILKTREDLNNDILVQQSKLAQENNQFIIKASLENEKAFMDYTSQFQNRALDAAKFVVVSAIQIYQSKVEMYKAKIGIYAAQAEVYKAMVAGEIAKADFYKAQIQGTLASVELQKAQVDIYTAQVGAAGMLIQLYKAQMEGAQIAASIDEIKIKGFAALVQAFSAQVTAASERYRGYQAQIGGEVAKAEMYKAQVAAFAAEVEAYKSQLEADTLLLKQDLAINENNIEIFKSRIQQYIAQVQASGIVVDAQAKIEGVRVDAYKSEVMEYNAELDALSKVFLGRVEEAKGRADIELKEADIVVREALGRQELLQGNIKAAAQIASQMAAAAISGVNASASIQNAESRSDSRSGSVQNSAMWQSIVGAYVYNNYNHSA